MKKWSGTGRRDLVNVVLRERGGRERKLST
jgi:hypothetical protein